MKYFTKYLSVEGEIEEGDMCFGIFANKYFKIENLQKIKQDFPEYTSEYKKVKLFLCSRDIQVGDKVVPQLKNLESGVVGDFTSKTKQTFYFEGDDKDDVRNLHSIHNYGKVIGEISPEATWLQENDEINEDQLIGPYYIDDEGMWHRSEESASLSGYTGIYTHGYKIQCPTCKHFH